MQRLPADLGVLLDRLRCEFRRGDVDEHVGAGRLQLDDVGVDGRFGDFVAFLQDDHRCRLGAESVLEALQVVLTVIVVLVEDPDLGVRLLLQNVLGVDLRFALVVGLPAHRPGKVLRIVPLGGTGGDEQLRHLLAVEVFLNRRVRRGAERIEDDQDFVAFDQLARLLDRLRRAVGVVIADEIDLAAVDAALGIDLLEVRVLGLCDHAICRRRSAVGHDIADLDFSVGGAGVVFLLCEGAARSCRE